MGSLFDAQIINNKFLFYYEVISGCIKKIDIQNSSVEAILRIREKLKTEYTVGYAIGDNIYFAPNKQGNILKYNYITNSVKEIELKDDSELLCTKILQYKGYIIFVPFIKEMPFIKLNIDRDEVEILYDLSEEIRGIIDDKDLLFRNALIENDRLLLPSFRTNKLLEINLKDYSVNEHLLGDIDNNLLSICCDEKNVYTLAINSKPTIFILDKSSLDIEKKVVLSDDKNVVLLCMEDCGDYILIPQREHGKTYIFNKGDCSVEEIDILKDVKDFEGKAFTKTIRLSDKKVLLVLKDVDSVFGIWHIDDRVVEWMKIKEELEIIDAGIARQETESCNLINLIKTLEIVI